MKFKEIYDDEINATKQKKNEIVLRVAEEMDVKYLDINEYMLTEGKMYRHIDHIHFVESAKKFIVKKMLSVL